MDNCGDITLVLDANGRFEMLNDRYPGEPIGIGTWTARGDVLSIHAGGSGRMGAGETWRYRWTLFRGSLVLRRLTERRRADGADGGAAAPRAETIACMAHAIPLPARGRWPRIAWPVIAFVVTVAVGVPVEAAVYPGDPAAAAADLAVAVAFVVCGAAMSGPGCGTAT